jgi:hypothetical protein
VLVTNGACGNVNPPQENVPFPQIERWGQQLAEAVAGRLVEASPLPHPSLRTASRTVPLPMEVLNLEEIEAFAEKALADAKGFQEWGERYRRAVESWRRSMTREVRMGKSADFRDIELQAVRIGRIVLVALGAEVFSKFTDQVRTLTGPNVYTVGYANGLIGYLPSIEAYREGGYEVEAAHLFYNSFRPKAGGLELLAQHAAQLVGEIQE